MDLTPELRQLQLEIEAHARDYGLDFFEVIYEVLDWNQMSEVAAYGGFPNRYPHWRFGMEYESLSRQYAYGLSKIFEMVINTDPCYAYLLYCNHLVDQKMVMAHVAAHCDFFKNNLYFAHTNRKMMDEMANHKSRVQRYMDRYGVERVESFIDSCLSIDSLIDYHAAAIRRQPIHEGELFDGGVEDTPAVRRIRGKSYMEKYLNPREYIEAQEERLRHESEVAHCFPESPERDVMGFLLNYAPLENWERDVLAMIREEAYYFAPQGQTKIMNEGWACVTGETRIVTNRGSLPAREIVEKKIPLAVFDGRQWQQVVDYAHFKNRRTVRIVTKRGFVIEGSNTHQLLMADGVTWKRLDQLKMGDDVSIANAGGSFSLYYSTINWEPARRHTLCEIAEIAGVNISTVWRHHSGQFISRSAATLDPLLAVYQQELATVSYMASKRRPILVPGVMNEDLAAFLGYLIGDGHISCKKRVVGLTTGDEEPKNKFAELGKKLFGLDATIRKDQNRWRVLFHSQDLIDFLKFLGMATGRCARVKKVPELIWRSPKSVVASFLSAYFDCDGHGGKQGIILSTFSNDLAIETQQLLVQFGIFSNRNRSGEGWHVHITSGGAVQFFNEITFGISRKQSALKSYLNARKQWKRASWRDSVVTIQVGMQDVYDFTVENTHRYVAGGFVNHNSFWHSKIMTEKVANDSEIIDFADRHSGTMAMAPGQLNPYKIGLELFRDIEERWNVGKFGPEYESCANLTEKLNWKKSVGKGMEKIFEVRKLYCDVTFIDEFLTPEFCKKNKLFVYGYNYSSDQFEIVDREFQKIKQQLLFQLTNFGYPIITVVDGNYKNRGELLLKHTYEGVGLRPDYAEETLKNLHTVWRRPVNIETVVEGVTRILCFDGQEYKEFRP